MRPDTRTLPGEPAETLCETVSHISEWLALILKIWRTAMTEKDKVHQAENEPSWQSYVQTFANLIQVMTVVAGVVVSILSFNFTQNRERDVRGDEAKKYQDQRNDELECRRTEAAKPFLEMRQQKYMEAIKVAGVLASPAGRAATEIAAARAKFPRRSEESAVTCNTQRRMWD
jgi:hypothetical protein